MNIRESIPQDHPLIQRLLEAVGFTRYVVKRFIDDNCQQNAMALTYYSLFALVPLMTVGFAMFSAIPSFEHFGDQVQSFIFQHFVPTTGSEVQSYLDSFSKQARSLTGIGVAALGLTAYLMLRSIEKNFNKIWRTRENRKGLNTFLLYWAILSLGPVLLGTSLVMTTYMAVFVKDYDVLGLLPYTLKYLPLLLTSLTFTLLFFAIPNCKVPLKHAIIGGLTSGILFEVGKNLFATMMGNSNYQQVYGTFATLPLFLMWLYISWLLVLGGAEFVRALSSYHSLRATKHPDLVVGCVILHQFWACQHKGDPIKESTILKDDWLFGHDINREQWERLRNNLLQHKVLAITESSDYLLAKDLHKVTLWDLHLMINTKLKQLYVEEPTHTSSARMERDNEWYSHILGLIRREQQSHFEFFNISLAEIFETQQVASNDSQFLHSS